ncbi:MAG: DUF4783 domain-containing protein [Bacteroidales bacterium]
MISKQIHLRSLLSIILFFFMFSQLQAQDYCDSADKIKKNIDQANSENLASYFDSTIDLRLPGIDGTFSSKQAQVIIKDFFKGNPPKSFCTKHKGNSNDGSHYVIGNYTSGEKNYRTYFLLKKRNGRYLIQQLQFEEE